jgi:serine protease
MCGRILAQLTLVVSRREDLPAADEDRTDRDVGVFRCTLGLPQGQTHEVVIAWEEALAHQSHRCLREWMRPAHPRHAIIAQKPMPPRLLHRRASLEKARRVLMLAACCGAITPLCAPAAVAAAPRGVAQGAYVPNEILVRYASTIRPAAGGAVARSARRGQAVTIAAHTSLLHLAAGVSVMAALHRLHGRRGVLWAVPDYLAHTSDSAIPNDPGTGNAPGDWRALQWNFAGPFGVNAPEAWANADHAPGGQNVVVAVLDTGVAYANRGPYRRSPDFSPYRFVQGYDFVAHNSFPNDRNGHGTFVAGTIAETTGNHYGLTGLAFRARVMPVRVLDNQGEGEASTIAQGVLFAVKHGARVINLSLEFSSNITASDIPELIEALRYAHRHGVLVVAAAGNEGHAAIAYPARAPDVVAVGATTEHGCLADYSNDGAGLTLVAPGGGADAPLAGDPNCHPEQPPGRDIYQMTFIGSSPRSFGFPSGYEGTSMAAPHVSATAALIIASGILGRHPTPAQLVARLRATTRKLGGGGDERRYGAGLLDAAAATARGGPGAAVAR